MVIIDLIKATEKLAALVRNIFISGKVVAFEFQIPPEFICLLLLLEVYNTASDVSFVDNLTITLRFSGLSISTNENHSYGRESKS